MPRAVYVHLPFCSQHCTYCPFAISTDLTLQDQYIDALLREIDEAAGRRLTSRRDGGVPSAGNAGVLAGAVPAPREAIDSIYLGGGTPSRTSITNLEKIFAKLRERFDVAQNAEISMEANPEDVNARTLEAWPVNRLSIGVQSFHDDELKAISRVHDRAQAIEAIRKAVASGVRTNLDLMLGLPGQTADSFRETLDIAVDLGAGHLSLYMLDLEEKTPLQVQVARGRVALPEDELVAQLYLEAIERLREKGLHQYEISNFARDGRGVPPQSPLLDARRVLRLRSCRAFVPRRRALRQHARHPPLHRALSRRARLLRNARRWRSAARDALSPAAPDLRHTL